MFWNPAPAPPPARSVKQATQLIREDLYPYLGLIAALVATPLIDWPSLVNSEFVFIIRSAYFCILAIGSIYVGTRRQDLDESVPISGKSAATAPIFASVTLGGLYLLLKYIPDLNPGTLYKILACLFGAVAITELLEPLFGLTVAGELFRSPSEEFTEERETEIVNGGTIPALAIALAVVAAYLQGPAYTGGLWSLTNFAVLNNCLAGGISLLALGVLVPEGFLAGAGLLLGLFFYDAFFVFKSDVMITVATKIEAPAKFIIASVKEASSDRYPFGVLGLGDIVIPGSFISLMREVDNDGLSETAGTSKADSGWEASPYFFTGIAAYSFGLIGTTVASFITKAGQPALVYIVPSLLVAAGVLASSRGELASLLQFKSSKAEAAKKKLEAQRAALAEKKEKEKAEKSKGR